jgi:hypothetical protein
MRLSARSGSKCNFAHCTTLVAAALYTVFISANGVTADNQCEPHWDATIGQPGVSGTVNAIVIHNGDVIVGGSFATTGGQTVNGIARWDGSEWHPFQSGGQIGVSSHYVFALAVYNGELIAGGDFTTAGGQTVNNIARWDGAAWHSLASGGQIGVGFEPYDWVQALAVYNGDLYVGGVFTTAGGKTVNRIAKWDGEEWSALGSVVNPGSGPGFGPRHRALRIRRWL